MTVTIIKKGCGYLQSINSNDYFTEFPFIPDLRRANNKHNCVYVKL